MWMDSHCSKSLVLAGIETRKGCPTCRRDRHWLSRLVPIEEERLENDRNKEMDLEMR